MDREVERLQMIRKQLKRRNIHDERVLQAMAAVPRHCFVPPKLEQQAYADSALPIAEGQVISQPYIVALTAAAPYAPQPLLDQLAPGGRLVIPIGAHDEQDLVRIVRTPKGWREDSFGPVRFVLLIGKYGWSNGDPKS